MKNLIDESLNKISDIKVLTLIFGPVVLCLAVDVLIPNVGPDRCEDDFVFGRTRRD